MTYFNLNFFHRLHHDKKRYFDLSSTEIAGWDRSAKIRGGPYAGRITIEHQQSFSLAAIYNVALGLRVEENNGTYWHGIVQAMEFKHDGLTERISLDGVANRVASRYNDGETEVISGYAEDQLSFTDFGIIETIIDTDAGLDVANAQANSYLAQNAYTRSKVVALHADDLSYLLTIEVDSPASALLWNYPDLVGQVDIGNNRLDQLVREIINSHPYITEGVITQNSVTLTEIKPFKTGLEYLNQICDLGGANGEAWTFGIDPEYRLSYGPISADYQYLIENGKLVRRGVPFGNVSVRTVAPSVMRVSNVARPNQSGNWLPDGRDVLIDEVKVNAAGKLDLGVPRDGYVLAGGQSRSVVSPGVKATADANVSPGRILKTDPAGKVNVKQIRAGAWQPNIANILTANNTGPFVIQIKTNITFTNIMYWLKLEGYNYGGAAKSIDSVAMGYAYQPTNTILNSEIENRGGGITIDTQYISADNFVCLKISANSLYFAGILVHAQTANPAGNGFAVEVSEWVQSTTEY